MIYISQGPVASLHLTELEWYELLGQVELSNKNINELLFFKMFFFSKTNLDPVHVSGASQTSVDDRHTNDDVRNWQLESQHDPPSHLHKKKIKNFKK